MALIAGACGSDGDSTESSATTDPATSTETSAPTTPDVTVDPVDTIDPADVPQRVISLSPTHTEIMFAIGAGDQLIAVDDYSNYPAEALDLPHELSGYEPNVEAIAGYEPDLVLIGGDFSGVGDQLNSIDIETWDGPAALVIEDTYAQIEQLGALTGHIAEAAELVASMQSDIETIVAETPDMDEPLTYYHELSPDLYSADSSTFIGEIYGLLGLRNIADQAEGDSGGYPQLNAEFIVSTDPQLIFLADTKCCSESLDTVSARPGWDAITAVANGDVIEMDDDIASRWGPRVVDYLAAVAAAVQQVLVPA
ncbi:MAG: ABC transporter substrate-binding protein [Ilumatobacteraceae bacterium]